MQKFTLFLLLLAFSQLLYANPMTIQAEDFDQMSGIEFENSGTTIGYFDNGDWLSYTNIDFDHDFKSIAFRLAKASFGGTVEVRIDGLNGQLIGTLEPTATPSWFDYQDQSIAIEEIEGMHDIYLIAKGTQGVCNLDYFTLTQEMVYVPNWVLVWADEFNGNEVDETYWKKFFDGNPHNNELQFYTPREENIVVSDGTLKLIARKETYTGQGPYMDEPVTREYTSGKIETQGKIVFQYGKIEARMKLPRGKGTWPAFWMLGENLFVEGWPRCGEIDIMEHGQDFDNLGAAIHTQAYNHTIGTQITGTYQINDYDTDFHTYGVVWNENELIFNVDGNTYFSVKKGDIGSTVEEWPFDQPFWIILNHAVGGAWGGTPDDSLYPHTVEVDWVRVYEDQQLTNTTKLGDQDEISIFPNPARDKIQIEWEGSPSNYQVKVTALDGAVMMDERLSLDRSSLNVSALPTGAYFLSIFDGNNFMGTYKFVKE